jgi:hypothetical protein
VDGYIVDRCNTLKLSLCRIAYFAMDQATKLEHGRIVMRILGLPWLGLGLCSMVFISEPLLLMPNANVHARIVFFKAVNASMRKFSDSLP